MGTRLLQAGGGVPFRNSVLNDEEVRKGVKMPAAWVEAVAGSAPISKLGLPVIVPVTEFRDIIGTALTRRSSGGDPGGRAEEGDRAVQARPREEREGMSATAASGSRRAATRPSPPRRRTGCVTKRRTYWPFAIPARRRHRRGDRLPLGLHHLDEPPGVEGRRRHRLRRPRQLPAPAHRRRASSTPCWHTLYYTGLAVILPLVLGVAAALVFNARFPGRGLLRGLFVMPMMATPVAIALVWAMMFHPQLGVLNYLLSLVGIPPQLWVFHPATVIPSLVLVETWQWAPLVMLDRARRPRRRCRPSPTRAPRSTAPSRWQMFRHITLPLIPPFIMVAALIRTIDAVKSFDIIYAITQGGPGTASETINLYLYSVAFAYLRRRLRLGHRGRVLRARRRAGGC